tara:strand:+ start:742 stop:1158 length:417 start_codon:yes stop_codon:yes gene_type:complete
MNNRTFTMIKPDAVEKGFITSILDKISVSGFKIIGLKLIKFSKTQAEQFYAIHSTKPFFNDLVSFITRGPVVVAALQKNNAVEDFRKLIGSTDPLEAEEGTIRKLYATSKAENGIHGSDSDENAINEINFHFSENELF